MRAVVLGVRGQLGRSLARCLPSAAGFDFEELDIADAEAVASVGWSRFDTIFNAAAYTAVDLAETPQGRVRAWRANAVGVANLVKVAREHQIKFVHVSTEYVFDGRVRDPIAETEPLSPLNAYGAAKAAGDLVADLCPSHYIVRSTWLIGDGPNFVRTMLDLAARGIDPRVVADQFGRPTFTDDLAPAIVALVESGAPSGIYNLTNSGGPVSWADVARAVFELAGYSPGRIRDVSSEEYFAGRPGSAPRPLNSVLDLSKAAGAGVCLPHWRASLAAYVAKERARQ